MPEDKKLITQPHNPFLLETFRAFTAEGLPPAVATAMVGAHVAHAHAKAAIDQARALDRIATALEGISTLTDPVRLGDFWALLRAGMAKRDEAKDARAAEEATKVLHNVLGLPLQTDEELAS